MRGELNGLRGKIGSPFPPLIFIHGEAGSKICYFLLENHLLPPPVSFSAFYVFIFNWEWTNVFLVFFFISSIGNEKRFFSSGTPGELIYFLAILTDFCWSFWPVRDQSSSSKINLVNFLGYSRLVKKSFSKSAYR